MNALSRLEPGPSRRSRGRRWPTVIRAAALAIIASAGATAASAQAATAAAAEKTDPWSDARAALKAAAGRLTLADAMATLLGARSSGDVDVLAKFEKSFRAQPWKSALALGVGNGYVYYGWTATERTSIVAAGNASGHCQRSSGSPCMVVMADGKFDEAAFIVFSKWLGTRAQPIVLGDLLIKIRTDPYQGGVGNIDRAP